MRIGFAVLLVAFGLLGGCTKGAAFSEVSRSLLVERDDPREFPIKVEMIEYADKTRGVVATLTNNSADSITFTGSLFRISGSSATLVFVDGAPVASQAEPDRRTFLAPGKARSETFWIPEKFGSGLVCFDLMASHSGGGQGVGFLYSFSE